MSVVVFEDFVEASDKLVARSGSSGQTSRINGAGGLAVVETGATSGNWRQIETKSSFVDAKLRPICGALFKTDLATNQEVFFGLTDGDATAGNIIGFYRSDGASAGNWKARVKSGGTGSDVDLGLVGSAEEVELLIVASPLEVSLFFEGKLVYDATANIPSGLLNLALWVKTTTGAARKVTVDYLSLTAVR